MKKIALTLICISLASLSSFAGQDHKHAHDHDDEKRQHKAHSHGHGSLSLVSSGNELQIELRVPGHDIVGFEKKPKSKIQKNKLREAITFLKNSELNIFFIGDIKCKINKTEVDTELEEQDHHDHKHSSKEVDHAEFHVTYKYKCTKTTNLKGIEVLSFKKFSGMKILKAQAVTSSGQFSENISPKSPDFKLEN